MCWAAKLSLTMFRRFELNRAENSPGEFLVNHALTSIVFIHNFKIHLLKTHRTDQNQTLCKTFPERGLKIVEQDVKPQQTKLFSSKVAY